MTQTTLDDGKPGGDAPPTLKLPAQGDGVRGALVDLSIAPVMKYGSNPPEQEIGPRGPREQEVITLLVLEVFGNPFSPGQLMPDGRLYHAAGPQTGTVDARRPIQPGELVTIWAAKAAFEEKQKGSLEKGKAADFIVLDTDLMTCEPKKILETKVLATYSNGERVYVKP